MSAKEKSPSSARRPRANPAGSIRLDDLLALKDVKGGRGSVVFGERSDAEPAPGTVSSTKPKPAPSRKRKLD